MILEELARILGDAGSPCALPCRHVIVNGDVFARRAPIAL